ncbi:unnamed protein product [Polarella glacialis]|uniref:EF-hand domain-containing protein n=1 Tax=Polarella glacialis TaxID=89957 RepID=A0A813E7H7_POLGL|nr:unnamed protein product [Polarella glacialis]CAE8711672.1 unnamed protein product [Polarella glacialis]
MAGAEARVQEVPVYEKLGISEDSYEHSTGMQQAHAYLQKHQIPKLMESLLARAALERPPDLRRFLIVALHDLKAMKGMPSMGIFTPEDLSTMFDMWDEQKEGKIPAAKVADTLRALDCCQGKEDDVVRKLEEQGKSLLDKASFVKTIRLELEAAMDDLNT